MVVTLGIISIFVFTVFWFCYKDCKKKQNKETETSNEADSRVPHVIPYQQNSRVLIHQTSNQIDEQYSVHFKNKNIDNNDLPSYYDLFKNNQNKRNSLAAISV